jgi:hypothetical protein
MDWVKKQNDQKFDLEEYKLGEYTMNIDGFF